MKIDGKLPFIPLAPIEYFSYKALRDAVLALPEIVWQSYTSKASDHYLNAQVDSIVVRHGMFSNSPIYVNTGAYDLLEPVIEPVLRQLPGADRVRLARMKPGTEIPIHVDGAPYFDLMHRVHVVLTTNEAVSFHLDGYDVFMDYRFVYEIDNKRPHGVRNDGDTDRIHMVVDYFDV